MSETKQCRCCELDIPPTGFSPNKNTKDGLQSWCKDCMSERARHQRAVAKKKREAEVAQRMQAAKLMMQPNGLPRNLSGAKWCRGCLSFVRQEEFHKNARSKDGLQSRCRFCLNKSAQDGYYRRKGEAFRRQLVEAHNGTTDQQATEGTAQ